MKNLNFFLHNNSKLKKNQVRLIKLISILKYLNRNKLGYNQQDILNLANFFLKKEGYSVIKMKTLQKDLGFLKKNHVIKTFIIRLGEYKGSKIKYIPKRNAYQILKQVLNATEELLEKTFNIIYKLNKQEKIKNKTEEKNRTKNSSVYNIIYNNINNKRKTERETDKQKQIKGKILERCTSYRDT
ncbi:plasmid maintenance protein [Borrelia hermsii]|uniref:Putative cytosolic protein n=1 Tax=Borrelia hermsii MTW TaxID=1313291 RepID=W5T6R9_BORHE|nr:plasmid maintenance protein [Borrelia hermsii]AHH14663.1 Putative cytosolic protein [Borrelia hermsii MTW]